MFIKWINSIFELSFREKWALDKLGEGFKSLFSPDSLKGFIASFLVIIEMLGMLVFGLPTTPRGEELDLTGYELVFYDEFEGDKVDLDKWFYRRVGLDGGGYDSPGQISVADGNMVLTGEYREDGEYGPGWYGADIKVKDRYKQGYFEIRCKCIPGGEYWSAFWIQAGNPYEALYSKGGIGGAEIDIMEAMSYGKLMKHNSISSTIHCAGVGGEPEGFQSCHLGSFYANDIYSEYNTYGLKWTEEEYIFYVNGVETTRSSFGDGVSQVAEDVVVSICMPQDISHDKEFREHMYVDYVKIYQTPEEQKNNDT